MEDAPENWATLSTTRSETAVSGKSRASGDPPVVFFVDDDDSVRSVYGGIMRRNGIRVIEAASAEEAGRLVEVMDAAKLAGARELAVATRRKERR